MPFTALGLPASIVKAVRASGYTEPMPIQRRAIPIILAGGDMIGAAQTGTGKTAAFILPLLARLIEGTPGLRVLVLTPTRELAAQVETNARAYARFTRLTSPPSTEGCRFRPRSGCCGARASICWSQHRAGCSTCMAASR